MPSSRFTTFALVLLLVVPGAGCNSSPDGEPGPIPVPEEILPRTSPDNLLTNLERIYNDKLRSAIERRELYEQLLPPDGVPPQEAFTFYLQPSDIQNGLPPSWPKDEEIAAHEAIFNAQEAGDIHSIELHITRNPPTDVNQVGREGWKEIFATNVYLRFMFNPEDGLEVNGGQAEFLFAPPVSGLYVINEWTDLPRLGL